MTQHQDEMRNTSREHARESLQQPMLQTSASPDTPPETCQEYDLPPVDKWRGAMS